ncbi:TIGR03749 family integrating conjugative element protein [Pseudomonas sp. RL]|uniref:TIGR03749 family integrating conjugative element protein n=1 Tax=Pseudomonas sp. RL TaxID=1452718 RepID=UPI000690851C|nr:TIGR03749 family integrating conjugative element protein [Pseudomonas sp. RL]
MRWAVIRGAVLMAVLGLAPLSQAVEILRWERLPLSVSLQVGEERVVFVDRRVRVGVPAGVGARLRVQSAGGALYLRASEALGPTRLQVQDVDSGALLLLDVVASAAAAGEAPLEPLRIVSEEAATAGEMELPTPRPTPTPLPVALTRYAAQMLYAPLRTVEPLLGIARVGLRPDLPLQTLLPALPVQARALAAWRLDDYWVSAVRLSNQSTRWLELDPRALQGAFVAATFQHATLGPAGEATDTTVVYLVTRGQGLAGALLPVPVVPAQ